MIETFTTEVQPRKRGGNLPGRRAGIGRKKGVPNKVTKLVKDVARSLTLGNDKVVEQIRKKFENGNIDPSLFNKLLEYGYGKPKQTIEIIPPEPPALRAAREFYESLTPEQRKVALDFARRRRAIAQVIDVTPGDAGGD